VIAQSLNDKQDLDSIVVLNRARAAVLARLSDECLDEYYPMTYAVRALRGYLDDAAAGREADR